MSMNEHERHDQNEHNSCVHTELNLRFLEVTNGAPERGPCTHDQNVPDRGDDSNYEERSKLKAFISKVGHDRCEDL